MVTAPTAVNLTALPIRFESTCSSLCLSVRIGPSSSETSVRNTDAFVFRLGGVILYDRSDDFRDVDVFQMQRRASRFEPRVIQQVVDQLKQRACVALHACDGFVLQRGERQLAVALKQLAQTDDDVQGRAQLVRDVGDESGLQAVVLAQAIIGGDQLVMLLDLFRDVAKDRDRAFLLPVFADQRMWR